jgi:uncharacterized LabA/DUF88 family protein
VVKRIAILVDGGHLRAQVQRLGRAYDPDYIEKCALACRLDKEEVFRILYYDCAPYDGTATLPVSGQRHEFRGATQWLHELARKDLFAVRLGVLKFRGFKLKQVPIALAPLTDADFRADFEQKGVDMRIGLDIAHFANTRSVDRIVLISNDTDCIPAMKHGRKAGLQIVLISFPNQRPARELLEHADYHRQIAAWPA